MLSYLPDFPAELPLDPNSCHVKRSDSTRGKLDRVLIADTYISSLLRTTVAQDAVRPYCRSSSPQDTNALTICESGDAVNFEFGIYQ